MAVPTRYKGYAYLSLAWDEMELGRLAAARHDLAAAVAKGTDPASARWVGQEIARG